MGTQIGTGGRRPQWGRGEETLWGGDPCRDREEETPMETGRRPQMRPK